MDFIEELRNLSARITKQKDDVITEEGTKTAFVLPFINLLGYDVFNPNIDRWRYLSIYIRIWKNQISWTPSRSLNSTCLIFNSRW